MGPLLFLEQVEGGSACLFIHSFMVPFSPTFPSTTPSRSSKGHWEGRLLSPAQAPAGSGYASQGGQVCAGGKHILGRKTVG